MKNILISIFAIFFLTACSGQRISIRPIFFKNTGNVKADSRYYEGKAQSLARQIYYDSKQSNVNKIAVMDLMDITGKIPLMGRFLGDKISSVIIQSEFFSIVQKGELQYNIEKLQIYENTTISTATLTKLGKMLSVDAILTGSIIDLGTSFDVTLMSIDVKTGDIIASATEEIARTKYAVDLMKAF